MNLFIDTANIAEIEEASKWGVISGVTTNPSLIAKEGQKLEDVIKKIVTLVDGPISAEVDEGMADDMISQARILSTLHPNIVIKLPMTIEGVKACSVLSREGIHTNVTLIFSVSQALMACEAGATYISPFMGRMDDAGFDSSRLISEIVTVIQNYQYDTQIIAASIRSLDHVNKAAVIGADIATIPFKVLKQMVVHPLTTAGLKIFAEASKK